MRVFIGIKVSKNLREEILKWQKVNENLPVRFIKSKNLHITLVPPWHENNINRLVKYLKKFRTDIIPFDISLDKISQGPEFRPRVIWAEGKTPRELSHLSKELNKYLKRPKQNRPFKTHITIARFKKDASIPDINTAVDWKMQIEEITLYESVLSPRGADYEIISIVKI
jgi:2'-5' RNA ligase